MTEIAIVSAARTPIGSFGGALSTLRASELGAIAIKEALARASLLASEINDVIMGHVLTAGCGQNTARQAAINAGIPDNCSAITINQVCGSGLRAVAMASQAIHCGDAEIIIAGGHESMSQSAHAAQLRSGKKMGPLEMGDTMIIDGLWDAFNNYHMGKTAENVATQWDISRETQDNFAASSQTKAVDAQNSGRFTEELVPVTIKTRKGESIISADEYPKPGTTAEKLSGLRPAFNKNGSVTAGNASGINDGAAALVLIPLKLAQSRSLTPLAVIRSWATKGVNPSVMGTGPIPASRAALDKAGWQVSDLDLIEANEAFAAQACAVNKEMGWNPDIVNVNGGAIALGHPIGASGARVLTTLLYEMKRRNVTKGLATLCIGGGMGIAMTVER